MTLSHLQYFNRMVFVRVVLQSNVTDHSLLKSKIVLARRSSYIVAFPDAELVSELLAHFLAEICWLKEQVATTSRE